METTADHILLTIGGMKNLPYRGWEEKGVVRISIIADQVLYQRSNLMVVFHRSYCDLTGILGVVTHTYTQKNYRTWITVVYYNFNSFLIRQDYKRACLMVQIRYVMQSIFHLKNQIPKRYEELFGGFNDSSNDFLHHVMTSKSHPWLLLWHSKLFLVCFNVLLLIHSRFTVMLFSYRSALFLARCSAFKLQVFMTQKSRFYCIS